MKKILGVTAAIVAAALFSGPVLASKVAEHGSMSVDDKAGAFTAEGVKKAQAKFEGVEFKAATHYTVVTHSKETLPSEIRTDLDAAGSNKDKASGVLLDFARQLYKSKARSGVLTLVYMDGDRFMVKTVTDRETDKYRNFTDTDCSTASTKIGETIRQAKGKEDGKSIRDGGLLTATSFVVDQLKDTTVPENVRKSGDAVAKADGGGAGGWLLRNWWVLLLGLLGLWLVVGLMRALTGGGGGGGYGGGYGGGGGGFMTGLLGGMFGAMAGMYLYNSMFGGGMSDASAASSGDSAGDGGNYDTGAGDVDGGAAGGDGDWGGGGDGAGGDWGGGGGDFGGGGGDFGGGGDW